MERFLWVCLAGAAGSGLRYAIGLWASERFVGKFPYGTLLVNVIGCFIAAFVLETALRGAAFSPNLRLALVTGFCGGLTTYSGFNYEATKLFQSAAPLGLLYFGVMALACFAAGLLGFWLASLLAAVLG